MSQPGLGAMIRWATGTKETAKAIEAASGRKILGVFIQDKELNIVLGGEKEETLVFSDAGQSCCETRYMVCDDQLESFIGAIFEDAEVADAPDERDEHGEAHEVQFLRIKTNWGVITVANHNIHNGYYGGFAIEARLEKG